MDSWAKRIGLLLGGAVVVVGSFFGTLALIDYWTAGDAATASRPATSATTAAVGKPIFSLILTASGNNWSVGESKTRTEAGPNGVAVIMPSGESTYGFRTASIQATRGRNYQVRYDIAVSSGALHLGAIDGPSGKLIKRETVPTKAGSMTFSAQSDAFMVVLYNLGSAPASAVIASLSVLEN
jgi:hypothetical protein